MEIVLLEQTRLFVYGAVLGLGLGLLYDLFSFFPDTFGRRVLRPVFDLLYCLTFMSAFILLVLLEADGRIRWYIPGGVLLGLTLYFIGLSAYVKAVLRLFRRLVKQIGILLGKMMNFVEKLFEYPRGN